MRRIATLAVAAVSATALVIGVAGAQVSPPDPPGDLDLEITPVEGFPGQAVEGQVGPADIAERCNSEFSERSNPFGPDEAPWDWIDIFSENYGIWIDAYEAAFSPPDSSGNPEGSAWFGIGALFPLAVTTVLDDLAAFLGSFAFVMATLTEDFLVVEAPGFDPETGEAGPLITPFDVEPGIYAIAAACNNVRPEATDSGLAALDGAVDELTDAIVAFAEGPDEPCESGGDLFADLPGCITPPPLGTEDTDFLADALGEILPNAFPALFDQWALGFQLYCVLAPDGECQGDDGNGNGPPATPIGTDPRLTG